MAKESRLIKNDNQLYLYGTVGGGFFSAGFTDQEVIDALAEMDGDITVHINSGGGVAYQGVAIYNALKAYDGGEVTVKVDGVAASAASIIMCAGAKVHMLEGSTVMIHNASGITIGKAKDHEKSIEALKRLDTSMAKIYSKRSGQSIKACSDMMAEETWMNADEAIDKGFADEQDDEEAEPALEASMFDYRLYQKAPQHLVAMAQTFAERNDPTAQAVRSNQNSGEGTATKPNGDNEMPIDYKALSASELRAQRPDLVTEIEASVKVEDKVAAAKQEGIKAEQKRCADIDVLAIPGHEKLVAEYKADATKTPADFALAQSAAERAKLNAAKNVIDGNDDSLSDLTASTPPKGKLKDDGIDPKLTGDDRLKAEWAANYKGCQDEFSNEGAYIAFNNADKEGRVRIFGRDKKAA